MKNSLLIYVPIITPRVTYIFSFFFNSLMQLSYRLTSNIEEYKAYAGPKFYYAPDALGNNELHFAASILLFENTIRPQPITVSEWHGLKIFFTVNNSALPFDVFAASFYLISRYEEYLPHVKDMHYRYREQSSLAYQHNFMDKPLVNLWAIELQKILVEKFPHLTITANNYVFTPTIDIDLAYAHLGRSWGVNTGSFMLALLKFKIGFAIDKIATLLKLKKDRYDTYATQEGLFRQHNLRPVYFFLAAKRAKYDKNISTRSHIFAQLIKQVAAYADVGIHPSYQSQNCLQTVETEITRVEKHLQNKLSKSRQHFLRVSLPETYRCLAQLNITDDYSLAYAACPGFRASVCTPFFFYDLQAETMLPVKIHPSVVMDGTLMEYMHLTPNEAIAIINRLIAEVKRCKGEFVSIWHNHSLEDHGAWKGWRKVFEVLVKKAS